MSLSACLSSPRCRLPRPNFAPTHPDTGAHSRARETYTCELRIHRKKEIKIENAGPTDTTRRASNLCYTFLNLSVCGYLCVCRCLLRVCMCIFSVCACLCFRHCLLRYHFAGRSLVFINKYFLTVANWPCFFFDSVFFSAFASFFLSKSLCTDCSGCECVCVRESGQLPNLIIIKKKDELISLKKEICLFVSVCAPLSLCVYLCVCASVCAVCVCLCVL